MALFHATVTYSPAAFKGMLESPTDRSLAAHAMLEALGIRVHSLHFAVNESAVLCLMEGSAQQMMTARVIMMASGGFTAVDAVEVVEPPVMQAAMVAAGKAAKSYQAPH